MAATRIPGSSASRPAGPRPAHGPLSGLTRMAGICVRALWPAQLAVIVLSAGLVAAVARAGGREVLRPRVRPELVVRESTAGGAALSRRA